MSAVVDYIIAMREIAKARSEKRKKDALYRVLVGENLNYMIIRDLINAAVHDVVIDITIPARDGKDGTRLQIKRDASKVEKPPESDLYL